MEQTHLELAWKLIDYWLIEDYEEDREHMIAELGDLDNLALDLVSLFEVQAVDENETNLILLSDLADVFIF